MVDTGEGPSEETKAGSRLMMEGQSKNCIHLKKQWPGPLNPNLGGDHRAFGSRGLPGLRSVPAMAPLTQGRWSDPLGKQPVALTALLKAEWIQWRLLTHKKDETLTHASVDEARNIMLSEPWLVWLSGLSTSLRTKGFPV